MEGLPQELINRFCSHLEKADLKSVLTLTSQLRYAAEKHSGAFREFTIDKDSTEMFLLRFSSYRLNFLREVEFRPTFPPVLQSNDDDEQLPCRDSANDVQKREESLSNQIQLLFRTLRHVEDRAGEKQATGRYRLSIFGTARKIRGDNFRPHHLVIGWRVHLLQVELPTVASIESLNGVRHWVMTTSTLQNITKATGKAHGATRELTLPMPSRHSAEYFQNHCSEPLYTFWVHSIARSTSTTIIPYRTWSVLSKKMLFVPVFVCYARASATHSSDA